MFIDRFPFDCSPMKWRHRVTKAVRWQGFPFSSAILAAPDPETTSRIHDILRISATYAGRHR
jgi:hypothetical protein